MHGVAHYFQAVNEYTRGDAADNLFVVWPASTAAVAAERRLWQIFAEWNALYEAGSATTDTHPGHGGVSREYDELLAQVQPHRGTPGDAIELRATWRWSGDHQRYDQAGPDYTVRWSQPGLILDAMYHQWVIT